MRCSKWFTKEKHGQGCVLVQLGQFQFGPGKGSEYIFHEIIHRTNMCTVRRWSRFSVRISTTGLIVGHDKGSHISIQALGKRIVVARMPAAAMDEQYDALGFGSWFPDSRGKMSSSRRLEFVNTYSWRLGDRINISHVGCIFWGVVHHKCRPSLRLISFGRLESLLVDAPLVCDLGYVFRKAWFANLLMPFCALNQSGKIELVNKMRSQYGILSWNDYYVYHRCHGQ